MGIRELYDKEKKRRLVRRIIIYTSFLFIIFSGTFIYLKSDEILATLESDADPIAFLTDNEELPVSISSDDAHIPDVLRGKSTLSPLNYRYASQHNTRTLTITAPPERIKALVAGFTPRWTSVYKNNEVILLQSGIQAVLSSTGKDSIMILTIVSPIHPSEANK